MFYFMPILAAAVAVQGAPAQPHDLASLPGVKLHQFAVSGQRSDAIQRSMKAAMKAQPNTIGQLFTWTATINVTRETQGSVCTIKAAKAALDANVYLPQLADETKVPSEDLKDWKAYESGIRQDASDNLWFVAQRLPTIEQSLVGKPCERAATIWNNGITALIAQQQAFDRQNEKKKHGKSFNVDGNSSADDSDY